MLCGSAWVTNAQTTHPVHAEAWAQEAPASHTKQRCLLRECQRVCVKLGQTCRSCWRACVQGAGIRVGCLQECEEVGLLDGAQRTQHGPILPFACCHDVAMVTSLASPSTRGQVHCVTSGWCVHQSGKKPLGCHAVLCAGVTAHHSRSKRVMCLALQSFREDDMCAWRGSVKCQVSANGAGRLSSAW